MSSLTHLSSPAGSTGSSVAHDIGLMPRLLVILALLATMMADDAANFEGLGRVRDNSTSGNDDLKNGLFSAESARLLRAVNDINQLKTMTEPKCNFRYGDFKISCDNGTVTSLEIVQGQNAGGITGSIDHFGELVHLTNLDIGFTKVSGSLASIGMLTNMKDLTLFSTQVTGTLMDLQHMTKMTRLIMARTEVSGVLHSIANHVHLQTLDLGATHVSGDIKDLTACTRLEVLDMHATGINGDIASIRSLTALATLDLGTTAVHGHLKEISTLHKLSKLFLDGSTAITGHHRDLAPLTSLGTMSLQASRRKHHVFPPLFQDPAQDGPHGMPVTTGGIDIDTP